MPELDGIETAHNIREGNNANTPIIGVTANVSEQKIDECLAAGMNLVINKPVDQRKLKNALQQVISPATRRSNDNPVSEENSNIIDISLAQQHFDTLGENKFEELYQEAKHSATRRISKLLSVPHTNIDNIKADAHALVGLCSNFGFIRLSSLVVGIESAATKGDQEEIERMMASLEMELELTLTTLIDNFPDANI
jgi:hypothetical protein